MMVARVGTQKLFYITYIWPHPSHLSCLPAKFDFSHPQYSCPTRMTKSSPQHDCAWIYPGPVPFHLFSKSETNQFISVISCGLPHYFMTWLKSENYHTWKPDINPYKQTNNIISARQKCPEFLDGFAICPEFGTNPEILDAVGTLGKGPGTPRTWSCSCWGSCGWCPSPQPISCSLTSPTLHYLEW